MMRQPIKIIVLGSGQMGSAIARLVLEKRGLQLAGVFGRRAHRAGMDVGQAIGLRRDLGMPLYVDLNRLVEEIQPDIAIQATCSTINDAVGEISTLLRHNIHVISIAEEMAYPRVSSPAIAEDLHWRALNQGVSILGTGINPGFTMDLLVIALSGVCADIENITVKRVNDLSPYGPSVLNSQGVGLTPEAFRQGVENSTVVGHIGFLQSIHMIANSLGWEIDRVEQSREPIISSVKRETAFVKVEPGQVAGCKHKAVAYSNDNAVITMIHPQQIHPQLENITTGDSIEINGIPTLQLAGSPEIPGGQGTVALAVNSIPKVMNAKPGLHTAAELPVPSAMLTDVRRFLPEQLIEVPFDPIY